MRIEYWITKATNTDSQYIILTVFPWPQWLRERNSVLRYMYIAHHVYILILSSHVGLWQEPPSGLFFSWYSSKYSVGIAHHPIACYMTHFLLLCYLFELITPAFSRQYKSCSFLLRRFLQTPVASSASVPNSGVPRNFVREGGGQQIQLRTEDRENGDLGAVAP